jgi:hypothetical protein
MSENKREGGDENPIGVRLVLLLVPVPLTARLLALWLPLPFASGASVFAWMLVVYWLPSRANFNFLRWLVIVTVAALAVAVLAVVVPKWF